MQGFLSRTDEHITELQEEVRRKDEEIVFLRSMLASLSEKVDQLEKTAIGRMGEPVAPPSHHPLTTLSPPSHLPLSHCSTMLLLLQRRWSRGRPRCSGRLWRLGMESISSW